MSEEIKNNTCSCEHGCGGYKKHMMVKIFILVVIIMAFSLGMQIGELKGQLKSSRGGMHSKMMKWDKDGNYGYRMMGEYSKDAKVPGTQSPAPTKAQ